VAQADQARHERPWILRLRLLHQVLVQLLQHLVAVGLVKDARGHVQGVLDLLGLAFECQVFELGCLGGARGPESGLLVRGVG